MLSLFVDTTMLFSLLLMLVLLVVAFLGMRPLVYSVLQAIKMLICY